jgi:hypothetical protein
VFFAKSYVRRVNVVIDPQKMVETNFEMMSSSVCAILVKINDGEKTVRVNSVLVKNVVMSSKQETDFVIVIISSDDTCRLYGKPSCQGDRT